MKSYTSTRGGAGHSNSHSQEGTGWSAVLRKGEYFSLNHVWWDLAFISLSVYQQYLSKHVTCHNNQGQEGLWPPRSQSPSCSFHSVEDVWVVISEQKTKNVVWQLWHILVILIPSTDTFVVIPSLYSFSLQSPRDKIFWFTTKWFLEMTAP